MRSQFAPPAGAIGGSGYEPDRKRLLLSQKFTRAADLPAIAKDAEQRRTTPTEHSRGRTEPLQMLFDGLQTRMPLENNRLEVIAPQAFRGTPTLVPNARL